MKCVAVIPVKGREPLLYHTVRRLVNNHIPVVCCGHTISEKIVCEMAGGDFITVKDNIPIGMKWQLALDQARTQDPDCILYVGSSDWVSDNWVDVLYEDIKAGYAMAGKPDCNMLHIHPGNKLEMIHWGGYTGRRGIRGQGNSIRDTDGKEPIGLGRVFGRKFLDMIDWKLFATDMDNSIDYYQMVAMWSVKKRWKRLMISHNTNPDIRSLSFSTYRWPNKHKIEKEKEYITAKKIEKPEEWLLKYFPEAINIFNE